MGDEWVGDAWMGDEWMGDEWVGDAWMGDEWKEDEWIGDEWKGDEWKGEERKGDEWIGDKWKGDEWKGDEWKGDEWIGDEWRSDEWMGEEWEQKSSRSIVRTSLGKIKGQTVSFKGVPVRQFLGVPYAKPPLGERRFKKPEPVDPWPGILQALHEPPACTQYTENPFPWYDPEPGKSEDCMYLNIWAPMGASKFSRKAVMFWLFGGGYFIGSIRDPLFDGRALAAEGDIVVVTVSYRLGSFGFLYSGTEDAPGNMGVWDILSGLKWVRDHIDSFGGDPTRITIAGESAGAIVVGLLSVSPLARGLYARQIMQSGSNLWLLAENSTRNEEKSQKVAELVGCGNQSYTIQDHPLQVVACLRDVDALELSKAESSLIPHSSRSFLPQFGDELLPENPRIATAMGNFQASNLLIGNNLDEGSFQISTSNPDLYGFFGEKNPHIDKSLAKDTMHAIFSNLGFPDPTAVVSQYLPDSIEEDDYELVRQQLYMASGDFSLLCPTVYYAESSAIKGSDVYFYFFTKRPSTTPWAPWMGTTHYEEVQFVFGSPLKNPEKYEVAETALSADMVRYWSEFVKNGRPSPTWPKYSRENPIHRILDTGTEQMGTGPHRDACDFFRPYFGF
ncbi:acetylcholinesterase-1-like [Uloborus diversus]|uniref:acetylcholinesterase-1-like n=1 Tax=Uloborus diversus TaxID=327109 RepID=UPI00240A9059|nr:acetylcholinesterase-1-like [Uloborus diversus]